MTVQPKSKPSALGNNEVANGRDRRKLHRDDTSLPPPLRMVFSTGPQGERSASGTRTPFFHLVLSLSSGRPCPLQHARQNTIAKLWGQWCPIRIHPFGRPQVFGEGVPPAREQYLD